MKGLVLVLSIVAASAVQLLAHYSLEAGLETNKPITLQENVTSLGPTCESLSGLSFQISRVRYNSGLRQCISSI